MIKQFNMGYREAGGRGERERRCAEGLFDSLVRVVGALKGNAIAGITINDGARMGIVPE